MIFSNSMSAPVRVLSMTCCTYRFGMYSVFVTFGRLV
jgi:hypothetical protein